VTPAGQKTPPKPNETCGGTQVAGKASDGCIETSLNIQRLLYSASCLAGGGRLGVVKWRGVGA
jgi:hypothetical protein